MQSNFISAETNTDKLYQLNSFLKRLAADVNWEAFRPALSVLRKPQPNGGRPPFDVVLMFKIIVLKSQYNLSDEMTEFFIRDRKTFQDFLALTPYHTIPDAKTIWLFAEQMKNAHLDEVLFDKFLEMLESKGIKPQKDHPCVDAFWKLIWGYGVTTAKVAGSNTFLENRRCG